MKVLVFLLLLLPASFAAAVQAKFDTYVQRTLSDSENYGGCMAKLADRPIEQGVDCRSVWVSFSCSGNFASKDVANRNFESAQIAMLTGAKIHVLVDDTKKHNSYCFAQRIDVYAPG